MSEGGICRVFKYVMHATVGVNLCFAKALHIKKGHIAHRTIGAGKTESATKRKRP